MDVQLAIEYWSESVLCFDPEKVVARLTEVFPKLEVDPVDWAEAEVQQVASALESNGASGSVKDTMLRQIRGKARRNGPVFKFRLVTNSGSVLTGRVSRYLVSVHSEAAIEDEARSRIVKLFESFAAGSVSIQGHE